MSHPPQQKELPPLVPGDRLDQKTFHERYKAMPADFRAELIGGIVVVASPIKDEHALCHTVLLMWLGQYRKATSMSGIFVRVSQTVCLGLKAEQEPDAIMGIEPDYGGQTKIDHAGYRAGPPELTVEVVSTLQDYDFNSKFRDYQESSVGEYIIVIPHQSVNWFFLRSETWEFDLLPVGDDGIIRSENFPGLWLDQAALLEPPNPDEHKIEQVLNLGLASPQHKLFKQQLEAQRHS